MIAILIPERTAETLHLVPVLESICAIGHGDPHKEQADVNLSDAARKTRTQL